MQYVRIDGVIDPLPYLDALAGLATRLPPGAARYATDPDHYDFYGARCPKDLSLREVVAGDEGELSLVVRFAANPHKHNGDLVVRYRGVVEWAAGAGDRPPGGTHRLGTVVLDEVLPDPAGCRHEVAFTNGSLVVVAADMDARWG
jgi:hypothetical protein